MTPEIIQLHGWMIEAQLRGHKRTAESIKQLIGKLIKERKEK